MKVNLAEQALNDLIDIARWIARENPDRARTFGAELRRQCVTLSKAWRRYPVVFDTAAGELRKRRYGRYLIFYVAGEQIDVLRIVHGSRDWAMLFADAEAIDDN